MVGTKVLDLGGKETEADPEVFLELTSEILNMVRSRV